MSLPLACKDQFEVEDELPSHYNRSLTFRIEINKDVYLKTIYGESPQIAIWLENPSINELKNVYVTYRSGKNDWLGKVHCEIALPYWKSRLKNFNVGINSNRIDAVTKPTSKNDQIKIEIPLEENSIWKYYIEVNTSGDYNENYSNYLVNGKPDSEGNGQPSIVYSGDIQIKRGNSSRPIIIGITDQTILIDSLYQDYSGITTALDILKNIRINVI